MLYVSWCILYVSYMYPKQRMEYVRIHTEYTTIHVSTPSHMARPVRLWDTPGYNRIQQDTSARAYPHRLHTIPPDTAGIRRRSRIRVVFSSLLPLYWPCCPRASKRSSSSSLESGSATCARSRAGRGLRVLPPFAAAFFDAAVWMDLS